MSGPDTNRGVNFQYACTVGILLDFPHRPNWSIVQMEGDEDIEDITIFSDDGEIMYRGQIKQKRDPHQWQPNEFRKVLAAFAECADSGATEYEFIYAGSEGKTIVNKLRPILLRLRHEGWESLASSEIEGLKQAFGDEVINFMSRVGKRLTLVKRGAWKSIRAQDLRRLRKLLARSRSIPLEEDPEAAVYNDLFCQVAEKSEGEDRYFRRLTRTEVFELLQIEDAPPVQSAFDVLEYTEWIRAAVEKLAALVALTLQEERTRPDILTLAVGVESELSLTQPSAMLTLPTIVDYYRKIALVGESGSGKTLSLWQLALRQSQKLEAADLNMENGQREAEEKSVAIPVLIDLAGFEGEALDVLASRSFQTAGQTLTVDAVRGLARQGRLMLLLDDVDMVAASRFPDLLSSIRSWKTTYPKCSMVVTTHRPSDGHRLGLSAFRIRPLNTDQARQVLLDLGMSQEDTLTILNSLPLESRHLVSSPLQLRMIAYVYLRSNHRVPKSRGALYREVVEGILCRSEEKGLVSFERSDKICLLALLATWMQNNETYVISPAQISLLLDEWLETSCSHLRTCDRLHLRRELLQSGLLQTTIGDDVQFVHRAIGAYLAALNLSVDDLPEIFTQGSWRMSLALWASLRPRSETDALMDLAVEDPVFVGYLVRERADQRKSSELVDVPQYLEQFSQFHTKLITQFPVLLVDPPWSHIAGNRARLCVGRSSESGLALLWQERRRDLAPILWLTCEELCKTATEMEWGFPLPIWLLPLRSVQEYHPLELAYLWIMRSLHDLVAFVSIEGGIDLVKLQASGESHCAVALVTNRFLAYQHFVDGLPEEIVDQLPLYAKQGFDLGIEVHDYGTLRFARYAVAPGHNPGKISIVQSILKEANDELLLFRQDDGGVWTFRVGETTRKVTTVEQVSLGELMTTRPEQIAQQWLRDDLERLLLCFPPEVW
jgi:hypothetical protein